METPGSITSAVNEYGKFLYNKPFHTKPILNDLAASQLLKNDEEILTILN